MKPRWMVAVSLLALFPAAAFAAASQTVVPMEQRGAATYYVSGELAGLGPTHFMVDTGSGYTVINEKTLSAAEAAGRATYVRKLQGILADGSNVIVPVYRLDEINIGGRCLIRDVEVAVLPRARHPILGLSALQKVAPFVFSVTPPNLQLSHCLPGPYADAASAAGAADVARADEAPAADDGR
jgi:predicted aspartyl protease